MRNVDEVISRYNISAERMLNLRSFDGLKVVTAGIRCRFVPECVTELNLPAIARIVRTTQIKIDPRDLKYKQGRLVYPEYLNVPGEILRVSYIDDGSIYYRGIKRSRDEKCFPNMITLDIGTKTRIVSVKFCKSIVVTGATSIDDAADVVETFLGELQYIDDCIMSFRKTGDEAYLSPLIDNRPRSEQEWVREFAYGDELLYEGTNLQVFDYNVNMIKLSTHLCVPISRHKLQQCFSDIFDMSISSAQNIQGICIRYNIGGVKHSMTINPSGYFTYIGSEVGNDYRDLMLPIYNAVMEVLVRNFNDIISLHRIITEGKAYRSSYKAESCPDIDFYDEYSIITNGPNMLYDDSLTQALSNLQLEDRTSDPTMDTEDLSSDEDEG